MATASLPDVISDIDCHHDGYTMVDHFTEAMWRKRDMLDMTFPLTDELVKKSLAEHVSDLDIVLESRVTKVSVYIYSYSTTPRHSMYQIMS